VGTDHDHTAAVLRGAALPVEEFLMAVEAMHAWFVHDHDLMYTVVSSTTT
jgi:hypothetical protein